MTKIQIDTEWGPVTDWARRQAAENMRLDPEKKEGVEKMIGVEAARARYPEAYAEWEQEPRIAEHPTELLVAAVARRKVDGTIFSSGWQETKIAALAELDLWLGAPLRPPSQSPDDYIASDAYQKFRAQLEAGPTGEFPKPERQGP